MINAYARQRIISRTSKLAEKPDKYWEHIVQTILANYLLYTYGIQVK